MIFIEIYRFLSFFCRTWCERLNIDRKNMAAISRAKKKIQLPKHQQLTKSLWDEESLEANSSEPFFRTPVLSAELHTLVLRMLPHFSHHFTSSPCLATDIARERHCLCGSLCQGIHRVLFLNSFSSHSQKAPVLFKW